MKEMRQSSEQLKVIEKIDKDNMLGAVENFPNQCREAISIIEKTPLDAKLSGSEIDSILILGMGGSGISGDVIEALFRDELDIPVRVNKGYEVPNFANEKTLCFAVSYSGNTEETLSGIDQALERGCKIVALSNNGTLEKKVAKNNLSFIKVPAGLQPRAALGYLTLPLIITLSRLEAIEDKTDDLAETIALLSEKATEWGRNTPFEENKAQLLAMKLHGKIPIIYGSEGITSVAAMRWKCQFNETSKVPSFWNTFPELNHNEIVGWGYLKDITERFSLLILRDRGEPKRTSKRIAITRSLTEKHFGEMMEISSEGTSKLARLFSLIYFNDFVTVYLAVLNGVNPSPVKVIESLKKQLAEGD